MGLVTKLLTTNFFSDGPSVEDGKHELLEIGLELARVARRKRFLTARRRELEATYFESLRLMEELSGEAMKQAQKLSSELESELETLDAELSRLELQQAKLRRRQRYLQGIL